VFDLTGRTAVVTGAARGIGLTIAQVLSDHGASVAAVDLATEIHPVSEVEPAFGADIKYRAYECDVTDFDKAKQIADAIARDFGGVDILVNNAGIARDNLLMRMQESDFDAVLNVNLKGAFNFTRHLFRYLMRSKTGRVINISSVIGLMGNAGQANYAASKAGLIGLTKSAAKEFAGRGVTVNAIAPGFIETNMTAGLQNTDEYLKAIPLRKFGRPSDVAVAVLFLASDAASYITGEVIRVDGGLAMSS
jgi:3-oxoacyl-[acyl-carrier protein] reductase